MKQFVLPGKKSNAIIAVLLDFAAWFAFDSSHTDGWMFFRFLVIHAIACYFFSIFLIEFLSEKYLADKVSLAIFFFSISFFIPYLGFIGLYASLYAGQYWPRTITYDMYNVTEEPPLPFKPLMISESIIYGQAGLSSVVKNSANSDERLKAIMATRQLDDRDAIPILRLALKDPVDDVRLLAYSMLDSKEEKINSGIQSIEKQLKNDENKKNARLYKELAHHYWEFSYLGLAQGEIVNHVLRQSYENLLMALALEPKDAGANFELGRVLLSLGDKQEAMKYFSKALDLGISKNDIIPYMAEVAFRMKDFQQVKSLLKTLPDDAKKIPSINNLTNYWLQT